MLRIPPQFRSLMEFWLDVVERHPVRILIITVVLAIAALIYTVDHLGMNTSTKDMLSADLQWRQQDLLYEREFPQTTDNIIVVLEAPTPDQALDAAHVMYQRLLQERTLFRFVYYPNALSVFRNSALLFLDTGELQDLADNLASIQPFLSRLTDDQSLRGLFGMLQDAVKALDDGEDIDLDPLVSQVNQSLVAIEHGQLRRVSWHLSG